MVQPPANSAAAHLAGFQSLKPEKSTNFSIGFVAHPTDRHADHARRLPHRDPRPHRGHRHLLGLNNGVVVSPGVLAAIAAHGNVLDPQVTYVGISVFTNGASTKTDGVEFTGNYASDFADMGHVDWTLGVNYNKTKLDSQNPLPPQSPTPSDRPDGPVGPNAVDTLTTARPSTGGGRAVDQATSGAPTCARRCSARPPNATAPTAPATSRPASTGARAKIPVSWITDLEVDYAVRDDVKLAIGANNLFNHHPPSIPLVPNGAGGVRPADGNNVYGEPLQFSPFGINGGYYYGRITYTF